MPVGVASGRDCAARAFGFHWGHGCLGNTEIRQSRAPPCVEQHVARFQIAVDDSAFVRMLQGLRNFEQHRNDFEESGTAQATKIPSGGELHRQNHCVAGSLRRKYLQDRRMIKPARNSVLVLKKTPRLILTCTGVHDLEGDIDAARTVMRAPHFPLPARAQLIQERVACIELPTFDCRNSLGHNLVWPHGAQYVQCNGSGVTGRTCSSTAPSAGNASGEDAFSSRYIWYSSLRHSRYCSSAVPVNFSVRPSTSTT